MPKAVWNAVIGLVCLTLPQVDAIAGAQTRSEDPRATAQVHLGPLYLTPRVDLREFGIDTNVFNQAGEREKDFTFTVVPYLSTAVPFGRRGLLKLSTGANFVYYQKYASERSVDPELGLRGELYFNRLTLYAEPTYLRTRQRPSFEIDLRSRRIDQGTRAGAEIRVFPKLGVEFSARQLRTDFDGDEYFLGVRLGEVLNRESWTFGGGTRWAVTPLTSVVVRAEAVRDRFLVSPVRDSDSTRITAGVELKPRALISGHAQIGLRRFQPLNEIVPEFTGVVAAAGLSYSLAGSTKVVFTADRDTSYSFEALEPYYVATSYGVTVWQHVFGRFDASVGFERNRYAYRALRSSEVEPASQRSARLDFTDSYSASAGYRVGREGRFAVGFSYWTRDSVAQRFRDYSVLRIGTSFSYGL